MLFGFSGMTAATLIYCLGTSPVVLMVARALQGSAAAIIWVAGMALLADTLGADGAGPAIGWAGIATCVGYAVGPFIGGAVYDFAGHYAVFAVAFSVLTIDLVLRVAILERQQAEKYVSQLKGPKYGATDTTAIPKQQAAQYIEVSNTTAQEALENPTSSSGSLLRPSPPSSKPHSTTSRVPPVVRLLFNARMLTALWATLVGAWMITSMEAVLPLYTQRSFRWSSTLSGATLAVFLIPTVIDPYIGSLAASHTRRGMLATTGYLIGSLAFFVLAAATELGIAFQKESLWVCMVVLGLGYSLSATPTMMDVGSAVEAEEKKSPGVHGPGGGVAMGYGLFNVATAVGSFIGSVVAGWAVQVAGWKGLCIGLGCLYAGTMVIVGLWCGGGLNERLSKKGGE
ncbi:MAG: hypothetical protein Q9219_007719 [cf. Caloplaca sp. 3 TL-2023]